MTPLDWSVIVVLAALVVSVVVAQRHPIPEALMRPCHVFKMPGDPILIRSQDADGSCVVEIQSRDIGIGDTVFIEQLSGAAQLFYVDDFSHFQRRGDTIMVSLVREDPLGR